jgi:hypothetical protein
MAVTYRLPKAGGALQNPAYRPADVLQMRGSARPRRTPRQFWQTNAMTRGWHIDVTASLMTGGSRVALQAFFTTDFWLQLHQIDKNVCLAAEIVCDHRYRGYDGNVDATALQSLDKRTKVAVSGK